MVDEADQRQANVDYAGLKDTDDAGFDEDVDSTSTRGSTVLQKSPRETAI